MPRLLALALLGALLLAPCAAPRAQDGGSDALTQDSVPPLPLPDPQAVARAAASDPMHAGDLVATAVAQDPAAAGDLVSQAIAALPAGAAIGDTAARIAGAAVGAAPQSSLEIAGAAAFAAARADGGGVSVRGAETPAEAVQAVLTASAVAAAQVTQAIIVAAGNNPEPTVLGSFAAGIAQRAVIGVMSATSQVAEAAAKKAGATPAQAQALAQQAANLAAATVTKAAIASASAAGQEATADDGAATVATADLPPDRAAEQTAVAASLVAADITKSTVTAAIGGDKTNPVAAASAVTEAASAQARSTVASAASDAAGDAGAEPADARALAAQAGAAAAQSVSRAAAQSTLAALPDHDRSQAAAAAGPALAGGILELQATRRASPRGAGGGDAGLATGETGALAAQPPPPPAATKPSVAAQAEQGGGGITDDPAQLVPYIVAGLAFLTILGLARPWLMPDVYASRLNAITERRGQLSQERKQRLEKERPSLRYMVTARATFMRSVLEKLNIKNLAEQTTLKKKLVRAGYRSSQAIITFTFLRLALPLGFAAFAALLVFAGHVTMAGAFKVLIVVGAFGFGYLLPSILVSNGISKRQSEVQKKFPDALDLMVICIESGISLEAAFARVSEEMARDAPVLSEEIAITTAELAFLPQRHQALDNLAERAGTPGVKSLVTALVQSEKYGTPLSAALRVVSQESRDTRMSKAEEKAAALPAKLTVPMVAFFLPVLFLVLIGPTIVQVMHAFSGG